MKVCRLASRKNFVSECGNLEFNMHTYVGNHSETQRDRNLNSTHKTEGTGLETRSLKIGLGRQRLYVRDHITLGR